jgi:hypothetical protein
MCDLNHRQNSSNNVCRMDVGQCVLRCACCLALENERHVVQCVLRCACCLALENERHVVQCTASGSYQQLLALKCLR